MSDKPTKKKRPRKTPTERVQDTILAQVRKLERLRKKYRELRRKGSVPEIPFMNEPKAPKKVSPPTAT